MNPVNTDTIVALATPQGIGGLAVVRLSGEQAIDIVQSEFRGKNLTLQPGHTLHVGTLGRTRAIDEVIVSVFRAPHSFTRENSVEISCHGSPVIVRDIISLLLQRGARLARPGEFTQRAFLNGRLDLAQAEAVADLIQAETSQGRQAALNQMRGGFSREIKNLREQLIHFASLIELELDFGEEDVEFAKRDDLRELITNIREYLTRLIHSFDQGQVIKEGVATVIAGKPNAGKSTLLNALLNDERAIVSDIPGTTRDVIEDEIHLGGVLFRFIDTAGLRDTQDTIEALGIARTREQMQKASLILYLFDLSATSPEEIQQTEFELDMRGVPYLKVGNKTDQAPPHLVSALRDRDFILISAKNKDNLAGLKEAILNKLQLNQVRTGDVLVTNLRHWHQLKLTDAALARVLEGLGRGITGDFLAMDIRQALYHLGEITGEITSDDLLATIFSRFCIGK